MTSTRVDGWITAYEAALEGLQELAHHHDAWSSARLLADRIAGLPLGAEDLGPDCLEVLQPGRGNLALRLGVGVEPFPLRNSLRSDSAQAGNFGCAPKALNDDV